MRLNIKSLSLTCILTSLCLFSLNAHNTDTQQIHINDSANNYYIALSAGWEQQIWFSQNKAPPPNGRIGSWQLNNARANSKI